MCGHRPQGSRRFVTRNEVLTEAQLLCRRWWSAPFTLLSEELTTEPVQLGLETLHGIAEMLKFCPQGMVDEHLQLPSCEGFGIILRERNNLCFHCKIIQLSHALCKVFGVLAPISTPFFCHFDALQQELQTRPIQLARWWSLPAPELASLQALGPEAVPRAVPIQDFHLGGAAVHKDKTVPRQWVVPKKLARQGRETIEGLAHVHRHATDKDPDTPFGEKHLSRGES